jgi:triacylglycerol lipase
MARGARSATLVLVLLAVVVGCTPAPGASPPGSAVVVAERARPVVIVPGWEIGCVTRETDWDDWRDAFVGRGLPEDQVRVAFYNTCQSNLDTAAMIGRTVDELLAATGADKVNVIAHSMGALSARWCVRFGDCADKVAQVVTLAGANHGTVWAEACGIQFWAVSCPDMRPDSEMLAELNTDEAPAGVGWETWVSVCELVIVPRESAFLEGAVNHDLTDDCVDHSGWKRHAPTIASVTERLVPVAPGFGALTEVPT